MKCFSANCTNGIEKRRLLGTIVFTGPPQKKSPVSKIGEGGSPPPLPQKHALLIFSPPYFLTLLIFSPTYFLTLLIWTPPINLT